MISLETARKLKDAGLEWRPQRGDWYYSGSNIEVNIYVRPNEKVPESIYYAPRLDQLLAEIEKRGYRWDLFITAYGWYKLLLATPKKLYFDIDKFDGGSLPDEAAASALLWILEDKAGEAHD